MATQNTKPIEAVFRNYRLKAALLKLPGVTLTRDQKKLDELTVQAARNFQVTGHFLCPAKPAKEAVSSPQPLGEHECLCWKAVQEARATGVSACGLLEANIPKPPLVPPGLKEKIRALTQKSQIHSPRRPPS